MFKALCPGCGAEVPFRSAESVMAVCGYCQTTVLKGAESVRDIGKMSSVLEDYSPLQTGTAGIYQGKAFTLLGRIQLKYEDGLWNEWYALFDDGSEGWLSEASGQFVFTVPNGKADDAPPFERLSPGFRYRMYSATDVRMARCTAGQGELPLKVGKGWLCKTADFRVRDNFMTLDYSDGFPPLRYTGKAVELDELKCQLLRDADAIRDSAGRIRGQMQALNCPNCGAPVPYASEAFKHLVCQACSANVELEEGKTVVVEAHQKQATIMTSLRPGDTGKIDGAEYTLIGLLKAEELGNDPGPPWVEYLLYNASKGFLWLVESSEGWDKVRVLNVSPENMGRDMLKFQGKTWAKKWDYQARVTYAAGAFNWRVKVGDVSRISEYRALDAKLNAERTFSEVNWSLGQKVNAATVGGWFNKTVSEAPNLAQTGSNWQTFILASVVLWLLNLPLILMGSGSFIGTVIATMIMAALAMVEM